MMDVKTVKSFTRKQLALKLYDYFCGEKERDELYCPISEPFKRTKHVLELCDRTLNRWISEKNSEQEECYERRPVLFDSFDRDLIGRDIGKMMSENKYVTLKTLMSHLKTNRDMEIKKQTLWRIVRSLGFTFRKTTVSKETICE